MVKRFDLEAKLVKKRIWKDNSGVSEVVGSILILLMTVMLFSGIILWVWGLPTPEPTTTVKIGAEFNPLNYTGDSEWDAVYVNLTHKGGEEILGSITQFYLNVNGSVEVISPPFNGQSGEGEPYFITGDDSNWNIGEVWTYKNYSIRTYHRVSITLIDTFHNNIIWEANLWGFEGARPPIFVDKWADGNPNSPTRDLVQDNMTDIVTGNPIPFGIYATVTDLDGDLRKHSVHVKFTFGPLNGNQYQMVDNGSTTLCDRQEDDFIFSYCDDDFWPGADWLQWDGGILILNATDNGGHATTTRFTLRVYNYGDRIYQNTTEEEYYTSGNRSKPREYAIFEEVEWVAYGQGYVITNTEDWNNTYYNKSVYIFNSTDLIQVKVLSNILDNAHKVNIFKVFDATNGATLTPPSGEKFYHTGVVASYHKYVLNFTADTIQGYDPNTGGCYNVYIHLRDTDDDYFITNAWFAVKKQNGDVPTCPQVKLYADSGYTTETSWFNSWDYMYVEVEPGNLADNTVSTITVEIQDFWGGSQIRSGPAFYVATCHTGGVGPISGICIQSGKYRFRIDLLRADKDAWLFGNASYTLYLRIFTDSNEYYESLNINMYINSPASIMDIISGMAEAKGQGTYADQYFGFFYENTGGYWDRSPYAFRSGQTGQADTIGEIYSVSFADLDSDSDKDIVAALEGGGNTISYLALYDNFDGKGSFSRTDIDTYTANQKDFCSVATGDVNGDGLWDIVAGTYDGNIFYYANDGTWDRTSTIASGIGAPTSDKENGGRGIIIANLNDDRYGEIVVVTDDGLFVYKNQSNDYDHWDEKFSDTAANYNGASIAVGDVGYVSTENYRPDIAVGFTDGTSKVYLQINLANFDDYDVEPTAHTADIAAVGIGDIDGSGYYDIVVGNGDDILIYITNAIDHGTSWSHFNNDDSTGGSQRPNAGGAIGGNIISIQVTNIDGAIEDDIAISTTNGRIYFYRNIRDGSDWKRFIVDDINAWLGSAPQIYTIFAGDMNLGNPLP